MEKLTCFYPEAPGGILAQSAPVSKDSLYGLTGQHSLLNSPQLDWMSLKLQSSGYPLIGQMVRLPKEEFPLQSCLLVPQGRSRHLAPSSLQHLPQSMCAADHKLFLLSYLYSELKRFLDTNPNYVSSMFFKIQVVCLSYTVYPEKPINVKQMSIINVFIGSPEHLGESIVSFGHHVL